jgi:sugar lactone lactonase YvrE
MQANRSSPWNVNPLIATFIACTVSGSVVFAAPSAIDLPGGRTFPESLTSTKDGTIYVGSLDSSGIMRIEPGSATARIWINPGTFGLRSVLGVLADERSNTLWACSNDLSAIGVAGGSSEAGSSLKGFDLNTGVGKVSAKLVGERVICNDIAIGADGSAFVTNTAAAQILRLRPGTDRLEIWTSDPQLAPPAVGGAGLDGIAFGSDGNLYVDTYTSGELFRVNVKEGKAGRVTKLKPSRALALADAIRPLGGNAFLIIEGGGRLDRLVIHGDSATVETLKDGFAGPTGVTIVGGTAWVSEGQLSFLVDPAKKGGKPNLPFRIDPVEIPAP